MFKKMILFLLFAMMIIGAASAADQTSFKVPAEFEDIGDGVYVMYDSLKNPEEVLSVVKYNEHDWADYITNDTGNKYAVYKDGNNTYNFTDGSVNEVGSFEIVEVDGDKFIIDFAKSGDTGDLSKTYSNLLEFNKLNKIKPIEE